MKKIFTFVFFVLLANPIYAALNLLLTQGVNSAVPIAVVPFAEEQIANVPGNTTLSAIVQQDLQDSGQFNVKSSNQFSQQANNLDFSYWRAQKVNDVVLGSVRPARGNRFQVSFQLLGLYNAANNNPANAVLLSQSFTVPQNALRVLAHHISDLIYQQLTGVRGVFNTKIAYVLVNRTTPDHAQYTLNVADVDGFNPQVLLMSGQPIMSPAWSPNAQQIAYVSFESGQAAIYIQNLATGKRYVVSQYPGINGAPAFSPNGKKLALVLTRTGNPKIYTMNVGGGDLQQITDGYSIDTEPSWSPDGQSLLFTSNRGGTPQIYQYNFATKQAARLTFNGNYNARASYLPNSPDIILMHRENETFSIAKQNLQTSQLQELVRNEDAESPSVAPNGKMVIYATQYDGRGVLAMVSSNGRIKLRIPSGTGSVREPAWSPFIQ